MTHARRLPARLAAAAPLLASLLAPGRLLGADDPAPAPLAPEYELTVADGARIRTLFRDNAWMKQLQASNLFRGAMVRMGPVLYAVEPKSSWKGRLVDFLAERFLDRRPVRVSYFRAPGLVSPFGVTLPNLSKAEQEAARLVVAALRSGEDVATRVAVGEGAQTVPVTPIALSLQRFAVVATPQCLAISRDPRVAAALSRRCAADPRLPAAVLDVDTHAFFASWSAVLGKLFGVGPRLRLTFGWDAARARFTPAGGELTLAQDHILGAGSADATLLGAIPADALLFAVVSVPDPGALSIASAEHYFQTARQKRDAAAVPVALVYLGMRAVEKDRPEALSALLVPQPKIDDRALADLDALFNQNASYEVHASRACPGLVVLSPSRAALERIGEVCAGRRPSFRQMPPRLRAAFDAQPLSAGAFWNAGAFFKSALDWGWRRDTPSRAEGAEGEESPGPAPSRRDTPPPPELASAMALLEQLPMYGFAGRARGNAVILTGVEP